MPGTGARLTQRHPPPHRFLDNWHLDRRGLDTLLARVFWLCFITFTSAGIIRVMVVGIVFGLPAMFGVVFLLFLLCVWLEGRTPVYLDNDFLRLGGDGKPALPPPAHGRCRRRVRRHCRHRAAAPMPGFWCRNRNPHFTAFLIGWSASNRLGWT